MAFVPKLSERNVQLAPDPDRALSVRQTPPPAAPTQTRQRLVLQLGSIASAVTRPEVKYSVPLKVRMSGASDLLGPISCHAPTEGRPIDMALTCLNPAIALRLACMGTSFAGYARWA